MIRAWDCNERSRLNGGQGFELRVNQKECNHQGEHGNRSNPDPTVALFRAAALFTELFAFTHSFSVLLTHSVTSLIYVLGNYSLFVRSCFDLI
jgi:hypothetical protein